MKFKVTAKNTSTVSVEFEDGSNAVVPITKGQTKEDIIMNVSSWHNVPVEFDKVSDVPIEVGDTWLEYKEEDPVQDYRSARSFHYPSWGKQFDSLYWARQGDDTEQKAVDATIKLVKEKIPKGTSYKTSEIPKLMD
jgi:hypothetical protein|tara:strand:- start:1257 stop:1664 length:408 start_codon:yes stop_codon:yes gene_type:complete